METYRANYRTFFWGVADFVYHNTFLIRLRFKLQTPNFTLRNGKIKLKQGNWTDYQSRDFEYIASEFRQFARITDSRLLSVFSCKIWIPYSKERSWWYVRVLLKGSETIFLDIRKEARLCFLKIQVCPQHLDPTSRSKINQGGQNGCTIRRGLLSLGSFHL